MQESNRIYRGLGLLVISALFLLAMMVLAFTPLACDLWCKGPESYPEAVFLLYGIPLGLVFFLCAAIRSWRLTSECQAS